MLTTYIIEEKRTGQYGHSDVRMIQGTHMTISKGLLQIWNALREGIHGHRPVASIAVERVVSFRGQVVADSAADEAPACSACGQVISSIIPTRLTSVA